MLISVNWKPIAQKPLLKFFKLCFQLYNWVILVAINPLPEARKPASRSKKMLTQKNNPLHNITLENILTFLVEQKGWEYLASEIKINCFASNPSIKSSLTFLRKTPWARSKVESLYLYVLRKSRV